MDSPVAPSKKRPLLTFPASCLFLVQPVHLLQPDRARRAPSSPASSYSEALPTMLRPLRFLLPVAFAASLAMIPGSARADGTDAEAQRLSQLGHSTKTNLVPSGKSDKYGHAEVLINAPLAKVRQQVTDFSHYKEFAPDKFKNARVVDKNRDAGTTDLYFAIEVMHGLVKLTNTLRFSAPRVITPGTEVVEGTFVNGTNVKNANIVLTMREVSPEFTVLKIDLLMVPTIPAPQAAVDEELRDSALKAVDAIHDRAQGHNRTVPLVTASN